MLIHVDKAGNKYLKWAKVQLQRLTQIRKELNLPILKKHFVPQRGFLVRIISSDWRDQIYITGGSAAGGRQYFSTISATAVNRFYRVLATNSSLEAYTALEDGVITNFDGMFGVSLNGRGAFYLSQIQSFTGEMRVSIDGSNYAVVPISANHKFAGTSRIINNTNRIAAPFQHIAHNGFEATSITEDGTTVVTSQFEDLGPDGFFYPWVYKFAKVGAATVATMVVDSVPTFLTSFYSSLPIPHSIGSVYNPATPGHPYALFIQAVGYEVRLGNPFSTTGASAWNSASVWRFPHVFPYYDTYNDTIACVAYMPYASAFSNDPSLTGPGFRDLSATLGVRIEVRTLDVATGVWILKYAEDFPDIHRGSTTVASPIVADTYALGATGFGLDRYNVPTDGTAPIAFGLVAFGHDISLAGIYPNASGHSVYKVNGVVKATLTAEADRMSAATHESVVVNLVNEYWFGPWGQVSTLNVINASLNADGSKLWTESTGINHYWESGVNLGAVTQSTSLPVANAVSFGTHGTLPASGFYGVETFHGWRYDEPTKFKARVWKRVLQIGGGVGSTRLVQGGNLVLSGVGSFALPLTPGPPPEDGFSLDGTKFVQPNGSGGFVEQSEAEVSVILGVPTTFAPNGVQYLITAPAGAVSYQWDKGEVDLEYVGGLLQVVKSYETVSIGLPSRGSVLTEYIPATTQVTVTESSLVQDYLVMRDPTKAVP